MNRLIYVFVFLSLKVGTLRGEGHFSSTLSQDSHLPITSTAPVKSSR